MSMKNLNDFLQPGEISQEQLKSMPEDERLFAKLQKILVNDEELENRQRLEELTKLIGGGKSNYFMQKMAEEIDRKMFEVLSFVQGKIIPLPEIEKSSSPQVTLSSQTHHIEPPFKKKPSYFDTLGCKGARW